MLLRHLPQAYQEEVQDQDQISVDSMHIHIDAGWKRRRDLVLLVWPLQMESVKNFWFQRTQSSSPFQAEAFALLLASHHAIHLGWKKITILHRCERSCLHCKEEVKHPLEHRIHFS